jgi:hypothetical protein
MLIKFDPIENVLRKNMFRLGFKQSQEPQPGIKHLPKTKPKSKTIFFYNRILFNVHY